MPLRVGSSFGRSLTRGLIVFVPTVLTLYLAYLVVRWIDSILQFDLDPRPDWSLHVPGLGVLLVVAAVILAGWIVGRPGGRAVFQALDTVIAKIPLVRVVHSSLRDLMSAFVGGRKTFDKPVLVSVTPDGGCKVPGYVTLADLATPGLEDHVAVYFPQAYNFAGQVALFPRAQVHPLDAGSADVMAFIVSGGVSGSVSPDSAAAPRPAAGPPPAQALPPGEPHPA